MTKEKMTPPNTHLQLCVNDLLHPTESSETLLEALTSTQLEEIEKTLNKIKEKKQSNPPQTPQPGIFNLLFSLENFCISFLKNFFILFFLTHPYSFFYLLASPNAIPLTANPSILHHNWALVAAQIAKALADTITTVTTLSSPSLVAKPPPKAIPSATIATATTTTTTTPTSTTPSSPQTSHLSPTFTTTETVTTVTPVATSTTTTALPNHEPRTEIRDGVEWVSFVYSHHRILRRYSIRTDVDQVDLNILDERFKGDNCVSVYILLFLYHFLTSSNRSILVPIYLVNNIRATVGPMKLNATH